ncbi:MAG: DUF262 domain-containing protein, partial [Candidatus Coatesbacteria bacterium]|nr:DUF262 domain-containing protein [Candidatus Coatesbacteria bacterium]
MEIKEQKYNIKDAFKNCFYVVPPYQREYVWREENVEKLLQDFYEEFSPERKTEYFIGSIVVSKIAGSQTFELIDGQQRITTLFLVLCIFKNLFANKTKVINKINELLSSTDFISEDNSLNDNKEEDLDDDCEDFEDDYIEKPRLELLYEDSADFLSSFINNKLTERLLEDIESNENFRSSKEKIMAAYKSIKVFFEDTFKNNLKKIHKFYKYFLNDIYFIQIETLSVGEAIKVFETVNERGVGLNSMDLLKNLIFKGLKKEDYIKVAEIWKEITDLLTNNKQKPLRFLRYFFMANYYIDNEKDNVLREQDIYNWVLKNTNTSNEIERKPIDFIKKIKNNVEIYIDILNNKIKGKENDFLKNIRFLGGNAYSQHLLLFLAIKDAPYHIINDFARLIEVI